MSIEEDIQEKQKRIQKLRARNHPEEQILREQVDLMSMRLDRVEMLAQENRQARAVAESVATGFEAILVEKFDMDTEEIEEIAEQYRETLEEEQEVQEEEDDNE